MINKKNLIIGVIIVVILLVIIYCIGGFDFITLEFGNGFPRDGVGAPPPIGPPI